MIEDFIGLTINLPQQQYLPQQQHSPQQQDLPQYQNCKNIPNINNISQLDYKNELNFNKKNHILQDLDFSPNYNNIQSGGLLL